MNTRKFFEKAKENKIEPFELVNSTSSAISIKVFGDELENLQIANDSGISCRGIYEGKLGSFSSDRTDSKVVDLTMDAIKASAKYGYEGNPDFFIEKGLKYKRVNGFSKSVDEVTTEQLVDLAKKISKNIRAAEKRIQTCEVEIEKKESKKEIFNSKGLSLKARGNYIFVMAAVSIKEGEEVESTYKIELISDFDAFDSAVFEEEVLRAARSKLGGQSVPTGKYDVIYDKNIVPQLLMPLLSQLSAFDVQQNLSVFGGKEGQQVLSKKITLTQNPHLKGAFASSFDAEGVPTQKMDLFTNGVLKTYIYDLDTAKKDGKETTGNAAKASGNIRPSLQFVEVKKGRSSFEDVVAKIKKGIYITDLGGIATGLNPQSGDYSLQAEGYLIEDGKIVRPVSLITVAGNLLKDFNSVIAVANDSRVSEYGMSAPSIAIRKLSISGS